MTASEQQQLGALTAKVEGLEKTVETLTAKVDRIHDALVSTKGAWKALVIISGLMGAFVGFIGTVIGFALQIVPFIQHK